MTRIQMRMTIDKLASEYLGFNVQQGGLSSFTKDDLQGVINSMKVILDLKHESERLLAGLTSQQVYVLGLQNMLTGDQKVGIQLRDRAVELWHMGFSKGE